MDEDLNTISEIIPGRLYITNRLDILKNLSYIFLGNQLKIRKS